MMKYRFCFLLTIICSVLFVDVVFAGGSECALDVKESRLDVSSCTEDGGSVVVVLNSSDISASATVFDRLPTFVVIGKSPEIAVKNIGLESSQSYNNLIALPDPEGVVQVSDAPESAKLKLVGNGWKVADMKVVEYGGAQGNEGFLLVCTTLKKEVKEGVALVAQCNSFYESDISKLKALLKSVGG